jgi:uncharacterized membrane protein
MTEAQATTSSSRFQAIDLLRGAVMVLMVLDHARDFFYGMRIWPTDLAATNLLLFGTRFVTHFCAPVFVFLAGTSAYLYGRKHGSAALTRYLAGRGLFLVVLELTVVRLCWFPDPGYHWTLLQVVWALGWSMMALAALQQLPLAVVAAVGAVMVAGHNLLDGIRADHLGGWAPLWKILHLRGQLQPAPGHTFLVTYPLIPWIGVMALGFALGPAFSWPIEKRRSLLLKLGLGASIAFVLLRGLNGYGDPTPWITQARGPLYTALSFLNCQKYPPSLLFLLMTLGPAVCILALCDGRRIPSWASPLLTFGRVPLLFYVAHLGLLRYVSAPLAFARWGATAFQPPPGHAGSPEYPLWATYLAWALILPMLYVLCRWFADLKARRQAAWLSYL